ncbi:AraC family transcriptional regulator [Paenibacillus crassostreae]|uniref:Transcriptional regulator n=1 Tax=Paenibacillus crassostreae TaxID=1763538 RepID=A0A167GJD2_9BACL|nr:AraC family transcriptional regulator [Paenibacillus crassostreae]AOZ92166.1 AraC family transcriptional regulator [Paenibacillus crassostreae]OAB77626.1 transcriptional regulator [Paenibacillus crassostreae]
MINYGVSVSLLLPIIKTLMVNGYDIESFLSSASIDANILKDGEARIPEKDFEHLYELAATLMQDEYFGLHQGQSVDITDMGVLGYVMLHSGTISQALTAYQKYNVIVSNDYNLNWKVDQDCAIIQMVSRNPLKPFARHCAEDMVSSIYHLIFRLSCRMIPIQALQFQHATPNEVNEYISVFGVKPLFGQEFNIMHIDKEVLDYPILYADPRLLGVFETIALEASNKLTQGQRLSDQLYKWIITCMPSFSPTLQETAQAFNMSSRTLQSKLMQEGMSYNRLVNAVRKELAIGYLAKPEYRVGEIAYLLHYSEPSAFQSAFKKWTGLTPGEYRAGIIS